MNGDSYACFRAAGALGPQEPDDDPAPPSPLRCPKCGCFVSAHNPTATCYSEEPDIWDDGWQCYIPGRPAAEVVRWSCRRAGCGGCVEETYYL